MESPEHELHSPTTKDKVLAARRLVENRITTHHEFDIEEIESNVWAPWHSLSFSRLPSQEIERAQSRIETLREAALFFAIKKGLIPIVEELLLAGVDVNAKGAEGKTPLQVAVLQYSSYPTVLDTLLGENPNLEKVSTEGMTALHYAAARGNTKVAENLLMHGANKEARTKHITTGSTSSPSAGKKRKVQKEVRSTTGDTPLLLAVKQGNVQMIRFLLQHKVNTEACNNNLETALILARELAAMTTMKGRRKHKKYKKNKSSTEMAIVPSDQSQPESAFRNIIQLLLQEGALLSTKDHPLEFCKKAIANNWAKVLKIENSEEIKGRSLETQSNKLKELLVELRPAIAASTSLEMLDVSACNLGNGCGYIWNNAEFRRLVDILKCTRHSLKKLVLSNNGLTDKHMRELKKYLHKFTHLNLSGNFIYNYWYFSNLANVTQYSFIFLGLSLEETHEDPLFNKLQEVIKTLAKPEDLEVLELNQKFIEKDLQSPDSCLINLCETHRRIAIRNQYGQSVLQYLVSNNNVSLIQKLLTELPSSNLQAPSTLALANPDAEENGTTPLETAINQGNLETVKLLLRSSRRFSEEPEYKYELTKMARKCHHPQVARHLSSLVVPRYQETSKIFEHQFYNELYQNLRDRLLEYFLCVEILHDDLKHKNFHELEPNENYTQLLKCLLVINGSTAFSSLINTLQSDRLNVDQEGQEIPSTINLMLTKSIGVRRSVLEFSPDELSKVDRLFATVSPLDYGKIIMYLEIEFNIINRILKYVPIDHYKHKMASALSYLTVHHLLDKDSLIKECSPEIVNRQLSIRLIGALHNCVKSESKSKLAVWSDDWKLWVATLLKEGLAGAGINPNENWDKLMNFFEGQLYTPEQDITPGLQYIGELFEHADVTTTTMLNITPEPHNTMQERKKRVMGTTTSIRGSIGEILDLADKVEKSKDNFTGLPSADGKNPDQFSPSASCEEEMQTTTSPSPR